MKPALPWFRSYNDKDDEDVLDDFDEQFEADYDGDADIDKDAISAGIIGEEESIPDQQQEEQKQPERTVTFQQDDHPPEQTGHGNIVDLSARRLARQKSRLAATIYLPPVIMDVNAASIPTDPVREPNRLTKPVVLHGRLVERVQPDYSIQHDRNRGGRIHYSETYVNADNGNGTSTGSPPIRDAMERRSVFYRLTSDTARLRSFVQALDDVLRQTKQFQKTLAPPSCAMSSISPSSSSSIMSMSMDEPRTPTHIHTIRLSDLPRLLSSVPEGEDKSFAEKTLDRPVSLEYNAPDVDPELLKQFHHRYAQHVNIAAWRVQNLVTQAKALDARIWKTLYDYEQTLRGDTLQQRHHQSACLKLHKDYRRVNRALKLCLHRLSDDLSLPDETSAGDASSSLCFGTRRLVITKSAASPKHSDEERYAPVENLPAHVSKVGWIGPKPKDATPEPPKAATCIEDEDEFRAPPKYRAPVGLQHPAPLFIATRTISRKQAEQMAANEHKEEDPALDKSSNKQSPFYVSFMAAEMESMVANWKEDDTLTMHTLYEQHQDQWKRHVPWFLRCCGPTSADDHRDDVGDDLYSFDPDQGSANRDEEYDTDVRDAPFRWNRKYYPRQRRRKLSLPRQPREASF